MSDFEEDLQNEDYLIYGAETAETGNAASYPASIPEPLISFFKYWYKSYLDNNVYELYGCYENSFNKITEKFFKNSSWPLPSDISSLVNNDQVFIILYSECYYRHIYSKLNPTLEIRTGSYNNYCNLFNLILNHAEGPVTFELPNKWLWDIVDEFIYQFNNFQIYKSKLLNKANPSNAELQEIEYLRQHQEVWSTYSVLNALYSLVGRSNIVEQLKYNNVGGEQAPKEIAGDYGSLSLYRNLGYFSIIGLLRIHTLLGDYTLALKTMEHIELNKKAFFTKVPGCHFTTYYYVGFCYLMMGRYQDAVKTFQHILLFILRTKNLNRNSGAYDIITKRSEQMFALLTISVSICPTKLDDMLHQQLREKFGEQSLKLSRADSRDAALAVYEEIFRFGAPKFISTTIISRSKLGNKKLSLDPLNKHWKIFRLRLESILSIPDLKSFLNLYSSLELTKLAKLMDVKSDDELLELLLSFKLHNRQLKVATNSKAISSGEEEIETATSQKSLLNGAYGTLYDMDIAVDNDHVNILNFKYSTKFGDWFIKNCYKNFGVQDFIANLDEKAVTSATASKSS
ncbi:unnamed protein product [Kuraishia capsulata CBS 1993]|uniref:Eukaryotic translation initiation factor 3 subunit L n=1 Tax=Kuraishia capsulata CBS 1993 TaxID=1382522 RepID=W6MHF2_9ASCO|nr:uncharacterized protein KUCA_T00001644001 [Kuraishia capsulata CBS 1993]CDK25674.1 unnamed protein product [Kuraishia capsulata CBS 1993]